MTSGSLVPDQAREITEKPKVVRTPVPRPVEQPEIDARLEGFGQVGVAPARHAEDDRNMPRHSVRHRDGVVLELGHEHEGPHSAGSAEGASALLRDKLATSRNVSRMRRAKLGSPANDSP